MTNFGEGIQTVLLANGQLKRVVILPDTGNYSTLRALLRAGIEVADEGSNEPDFHVASEFASIAVKIDGILSDIS